MIVSCLLLFLIFEDVLPKVVLEGQHVELGSGHVDGQEGLGSCQHKLTPDYLLQMQVGTPLYREMFQSHKDIVQISNNKDMTNTSTTLNGN